MRMNKRFTWAVAFLALALVVSVGFAFQQNVQAQDGEDGPIVCDWTLITLLYISEHEFGHFPMTDVSNFDFGQYTPLFEAMMAEMEEMEPTEEAPEMEPTEEPEMEPTEEPESPYTQLPHGDIEGEPQACEDLRHELDAWFLDHFMMEMDMDMDDE